MLAVLLVGLLALGTAAAEQCSSALEAGGHVAGSEQAVVPDFHEAVRQDMLEKPLQKTSGGNEAVWSPRVRNLTVSSVAHTSRELLIATRWV